MLQALIVTLREGVEAALVIGIAVAYLNKAGRNELIRWVYAGLVAALVSSVGLGVLFARFKWDTDRFEGWVMLAAGALVASLVFMMWRAGKSMKAEIESGLSKAFNSAAAGPGLMLFVFLMILREGVETILLLAAVTLNSEDLWNIAGTALGVGLAVVFGILFVRGTVRVNLAKFFKITTVILIFVVFQLILGGLHELAEQGVIPSSKAEMNWVGPIVRNEAFFFVTILALAALMILLDWRSKSPAIPDSVGIAERRLAAWTAKRERLWMVLVCASSFVFIVLVTAEFVYAKNKAALSPSASLTLNNGEVRIPVSDLADGDLHRYQIQTPAGQVRIFALNRAGMEPAVAVDACEICGTAGYSKEGPNVICKNCGAAMFGPSIGTPGGCNPIPLEHTLEGGELRIGGDALAKVANVFATQK
jgi:high-affinity iron transporter